MTDTVEPFTLRVPDRDLDDLRRRLRETRWPPPETVDDDAQGVRLRDLQALCERWATSYDWRALERRLDAAPQFRTVVDGLPVHFLHARSPHPDALPVVLTHGWPGSVVELLGVLGPLTEPERHGGDPADAFHVVCPSLPGYAWSGTPTTAGWGVERVARTWAGLMARLGYPRYGAQGTDWGTSVSAALGQVDPDHVVGVHLMPPLAPPDPATLGDLTDAEQASLDRLARSADRDSGYSTMHRTRPQTVGYALEDSPAGLAAWIGEKLRSWVDPRVRLDDDTVLDMVSVYWLSRSAASSARLYWESSAEVGRWIEGPLEARDLVRAPVGATVFPHELQQPSRRWAERRFPDLRYWSEPEVGGHFPALEVPATFVAELRSFFRLVR